MKKRLIWTVALVMTVMLFCCSSAAAASSGTWGRLKWELDSLGTLKITGSGAMKDIGDSSSDAWLSQKSRIKKVIIGNGVTSIGQSAFLECPNITDITIPETVVRLGTLAFSGCSSLTEITIPEGVGSIPMMAFYGCAGITQISLPNSLTRIDEEAFSHCTGLTEITIPDGVTTIARDAFYCCESLTGIKIPEGVTTIAQRTFYYCESLSDVTLPDSLTVIGDEAFYQCSGLTGITIPEGVTTIGQQAFSYCRSLSDITLPDSLTVFGDGAFYGCSSLKEITIPENISTISNNAFFNCSSLKSVSLPDHLTVIGNSAFSWCEALEYITIPDDVTSIGQGAFSNSANKIFANPDSNAARLLSKAGYEFWDPDGSCSLQYLFQNDTIVGFVLYSVDRNVVHFTIPEGVTEISSCAFMDCSSLTEISIPEGVTEIGACAFMGCSSLESVTIPGSLTSISYWAFGDCSSLRSVVIPEGVTSIEECAFVRSGLRSVTLPESLTVIGTKAFRACSGLTCVTIPAGVTEIGENAFYFTDVSKIIFMGRDISFGQEIFDSDFVPTVCCWRNTGIENWARDMGYTIIYLDNLDPDSIRTVSLNKPVCYLDVGQTEQLLPVIFPDYDHPAIVWTSSDPDVVAVSDGRLEALKYGTATVTVSAGSASSSVTVDVHRLARSISFPEEEMWVYFRDPLQLTPVVEPQDAETILTWYSSCDDYATVDENGQIRFNYATEITITVLTENGLTASVLIHGCTQVTDVHFAEPEIIVGLGETGQVHAVVSMGSNECVNHFVTFLSDDESVAAVDQSGTVTGLKRGNANIYAYSETLNRYVFCKVKVVNVVRTVLTLPNNLTVIESEAFAGLGQGYGVVIPESVVRIADDAFSGTGITIIAPSGSYAAQWAAAHEETDWQEP